MCRARRSLSGGKPKRLVAKEFGCDSTHPDQQNGAENTVFFDPQDQFDGIVRGDHLLYGHPFNPGIRTCRFADSIILFKAIPYLLSSFRFSKTPPTSDLWVISGEWIFMTTGYPMRSGNVYCLFGGLLPAQGLVVGIP